MAPLPSLTTRFMLGPPYGILLAVWALLTGCLAAPSTEDWLGVGFRSPEQTFRTFQTGLRAGEPDLEYRCLGAGFKRSAGLSQLAYREFRRELFARQPWLKLAARARVERVAELGAGRVRLDARVRTLFHDERFSVELVREDFYELYVGDRRVQDDLLEWRSMARARGDELVVTVPLPGGLLVPELGELRAGREWKIDGFPLQEGAGAEKP